MADRTSVVYRNVRPAGTGVCAALVVFFAGCSEEPTVPLDGGAEPVAPQAPSRFESTARSTLARAAIWSASRPAA